MSHAISASAQPGSGSAATQGAISASPYPGTVIVLLSLNVLMLSWLLLRARVKRRNHRSNKKIPV